MPVDPDISRLTAASFVPEQTKALLSTFSRSSGGSGVDSVNGQTGAVVLTAADVEALPADTALLQIGTTATTAKAGNYAPAWGDVTGKPAVIAAGADAAAARTAIGAGTSSLTLAQAQAGIATKPAIAALTPTSTLEEVIAALQA